VPYEQSRSLWAALTAAGLRSEMTTVLREKPSQPGGVTLEEALGLPAVLPGAGAELAGHAAAGDVDATVFDSARRTTVYAVVFKDIVGGEHVVDAGIRHGMGIRRDGTPGCFPC
jgi:hypothetical protein